MEKIVVHIGGGDTVYGNADDPMRFAVSKLAIYIAVQQRVMLRIC